MSGWQSHARIRGDPGRESDPASIASRARRGDRIGLALPLLVWALVILVLALSACSDTAGPERPVSVRIDPPSAERVVGQTLQLRADVLDHSGNVLTGRAVTWASDRPLIATVDSSGMVMMVSPGLAIITATCEGTEGSAEITVSDPCDPAGARRIIPGQAIVDELRADDCGVDDFWYDLYRFTIDAPMTVLIEMRSSAFDAFLYLLDGVAVIDGDDDGGGGMNARLVRSLSPGTYYIVATSFWYGETGPYTLSLQSAPAAAMTADGGAAAAVGRKAEREPPRFPWLGRS